MNYSFRQFQNDDPGKVQENLADYLNTLGSGGIASKVGSSNMKGKVARGVIFYPEGSYESIPPIPQGRWTHQHISDHDYNDNFEAIAKLLTTLPEASSFWAKVVFDNAAGHNPNVSLYYIQ